MKEQKIYANKERGLLQYGNGTDLYGRKFRIQDGSWAMFHGIRIYGSDSNNEGTSICLSLKKSGVKKMIEGLTKALERMSQ